MFELFLTKCGPEKASQSSILPIGKQLQQIGDIHLSIPVEIRPAAFALTEHLQQLEQVLDRDRTTPVHVTQRDGCRVVSSPDRTGFETRILSRGLMRGIQSNHPFHSETGWVD